MTIVSSDITKDASMSDGRRRIEYVFVDHLGKEIFRGPMRVEAGLDDVAHRLSLYTRIEDNQANQEITDAIQQAYMGFNPDKVPSDYQTQADFDRRVLGRMMMVEDAHAVRAAYQMFQAMELRGGANANQRASYLGVDVADYNLIDDRFSNVNGVSWFLDDEKNQIWTELPEGFD